MPLVAAASLDEALAAIGERPGLALFTEAGCPHCRGAKAALQALAPDLAVYEVGFERDPAGFAAYAFTGVPGFLFVRGGRVVARVEGFPGPGPLARLLAQLGLRAPGI